MSPRLSQDWLDGRLVEAAEPCRPSSVDESGARGCYTTARVRAGVARHAAAHARRLARDTQALGLGEVADAKVLELFSTLGRHAFGDGEGLIRVEARAGADDRAQLRGVPRALGPDRVAWSAYTAPFPHAGPSPWPGAKLLDDPLYERARALGQSEGVDEVLLFDRAGRLVEGARSSLLFVHGKGEGQGRGQLGTPAPALGGVTGIALAAVREAFPELREREIAEVGIRELRELIAVNAVRGARAIVCLDGGPVGSGRPGPWSLRLDELLSRA